MYRCIRFGCQQQAALSGDGKHLVSLGGQQGRGLLDEDVLARLQCLHRLGIMQERRRGDVDKIDVRHLEQRFDLHNIGHPKTARSSAGRLRVTAGHAHEAHAGKLGELLHSKQTESATADDAEPDLFFVSYHE